MPFYLIIDTVSTIRITSVFILCGDYDFSDFCDLRRKNQKKKNRRNKNNLHAITLLYAFVLYLNFVTISIFLLMLIKPLSFESSQSNKERNHNSYKMITAVGNTKGLMVIWWYIYI